MSAIASSLSGIELNKKKLEITSSNVVNVDTEGYGQRSIMQNSVVIAGNIQGVSIKGITTRTDRLLEQTLLQKTSEANYTETKKRYFESMNQVFGTPGEGNSLDSFITKAFKELDTLSGNLNIATQKVITVDSLSNAAEKISSLARSLEDLRYQADTELNNITLGLNAELKTAYALSQKTTAFPEGSIEHVESAEKLKASVLKLSEYFELKQYPDKLGRLNLYTPTGINLLGTQHAYQAKYTPASSADDFIEQRPLNSFFITAIDDFGNDLNLDIVVTPPGISGQTHYELSPGKVAGLLDMRDVEIPKALNQLDQLAKKLKDEFNKIHNTGTGYPPATTLTATRLTSRDETLQFDGSIRIAVVGDDGLPLPNPSTPALTLDLSKLDTGSGAGRPNMEGIINEINYHFNQKFTMENSVKMGRLNDIKLAAVSNSMTPGASVTFDLELSNFSGKDTKINIASVTATDNTGVNILSSFNGTVSTVASGNTQRTGSSGSSITLNNTAAPLEYPYTIAVDCQVTDETSIYTATLTFQINNPSPDPLNGIINKRFSANSVSGQATLIQPAVNGGMLTATLVDDQGNSIPSNSMQPGRLNISTLQNNYRLVIDQLDSKYLGNPTNNTPATNDGFNTLFGLNDLFVRNDAPKNWGNLKNSAVYLEVRSEIQADPNLLSTGKLRQTHSNFADFPVYTYEVTSGDKDTLTDLIHIGNQKFLFANTSGLPATTVTFSSYATEILSFNSVSTKLISEEAGRNELFREALQDKLDSIRGVDLNAELTNLILYQQNFTASAKIIQTAREFFDTLISSF
ncbi:hypothetical protein H1Q59_05995 [Holosporaceae bacterium 'Namur']|nr:hypothetical protein [Holosporaceae bacterium 'Namur']